LHDIGYHRNRYIEQALDDGIRALQQLGSQGKIRYFGATGYPIAVFKDVLAHVDVDTVLCHNPAC
jgi:L-galactose dehydrogenase